MIISIDAEKAFDKIQHPFRIKTLQKVGIEGTYLNIIKAIYDKPTTNIILNGEKLKAFPLRSGTWQGCPLLPLLFNNVLEVLARAYKQKNKMHPNWKRRSKNFSIQRWLIYGKSQRMYTCAHAHTHTLLELTNEFSKVLGYNINKQKSVVFLYTSNEQSKNEIKKIPFIIASKRI